MKPAQRLMGSAALCGLLVGGPVTSASAQYRDGRGYGRNTLEGARFETMRSLAHFLDEGAQFALEESTDALANSRNRRDAAYLGALRSFAQRTDSFHERMDSYQTNPWDLDSDVRQILIEARRVNSRMRGVSAVRELQDDWAAVVDDVNRMQQLLAGQDVQVPSAHPRWARRDRGDQQSGGYDRRQRDPDQGAPQSGRYGDDPRSRGVGGFGDRAINGQDLDEFRRLAHELDTRAQRVVNMADRNRRSYNDDRTTQMVSDLRHFAEQTAALHDRTDADTLDPRAIGPVVGHLLEDARSADRAMRAANVFSEVWDEWQGAITVLQGMEEMVRR